MFEDSILESSPRWRTHRGWTTLASSALQAAALALMVLIPVLRPDALPLRWRSAIDRLPEPYSAAPGPAGPTRGGGRSVFTTAPGIVFAPQRIPPLTELDDSPCGDLPGPRDMLVAGPTGCPTCTRGITGEMASVFNPPAVIPKPPAAAPGRYPISGGVIQGYLVRQVQPAYPPLAKLAGVQGDVVLQAVIGRDGVIEQLQAISGHPLLVASALDAVRQWRYRPYLLNGQPIEVETRITVRFILSGH